MLAIIVLMPAANAGMAWGIIGDIRHVATNAEDEIYLATHVGVFKISPNSTFPVAHVVPDEPPHAIAASMDGSRVAIASGDEIVLTDGDLQPIRVLDIEVHTRGSDLNPDYALYLSHDGSRVYAVQSEGLTAMSTSDGTVLWSEPCVYGIMSTAFSSTADMVGYSCNELADFNPIHLRTVIVDGSDGSTLWKIPAVGQITLSPGGHWAYVEAYHAFYTYYRHDLYEIPSIVPVLTWNKGTDGGIHFLSDEDQFVHIVPRQEAVQVDWYSSPSDGTIPEQLATRSFEGWRGGGALGTNNEFLVFDLDDSTDPEPIDWATYEYWGVDSKYYTGVTNTSFYRFGPGGVLLESGPSVPGEIFPLPDSNQAVVSSYGRTSFFEPDVVNNRPVLGADSCKWEGDTATVDATDPDDDHLSFHWNFSRNYLHGHAVPVVKDLVDATGQTVKVSDSNDPTINRIGVMVEDEKGAISPVVCTESRPPFSYQADGTGFLAIPCAILLIAAVARRPSDR